MNTENGKNKSVILIVDDSEINREMLSEILKDDYDILEAPNGAEAITVIREHDREIDLVLLDIVMPVMDGFEVLALMNKYKWIDYIPVNYDLGRGGFLLHKKSIRSRCNRLYPTSVSELSYPPQNRQYTYALQQAETSFKHC